MSCCAVAPKYWPENFVHFINTRGKEKMMFGTEYPTINWERSRQEIADLALRESVAESFFKGNACRAYNFDFDVS